MYNVEQYVMAYSADHDAVKELLPTGYESLRPVLRLNVEVITDPQEVERERIYIEFNTPVAKEGKRGWFNLAAWDTGWTDIVGIRNGGRTEFTAEFDGVDFLDITFARVGKEGGCPREDDNDGTFFIDARTGETVFRQAERILEKKEYCDCDFRWELPESDYFTENPHLVRKAAGIQEKEILGAYVVHFMRKKYQEEIAGYR